MECPKCNARPPDGYGHQCSDGRWIIVPGDATVPPPREATTPERDEADRREQRASHLRDDIADAARRAESMARLEADLRRPA